LYLKKNSNPIFTNFPNHTQVTAVDKPIMGTKTKTINLNESDSHMQFV